MEKIISPSLLTADFGNLAHEIEMLNDSAAQWIHLDIMDGVFVPNISFGFPVVCEVRKLSKKVIDVHLMIIQPERYVDQFVDAGADMLTVHVEACTHLHRTIQQIKGRGIKAGVVLNPHTPLSSIEEVLSDVDMVLLMTVNPGFGGQSFIPQGMDKIRRLRKMIDDRGLKTLIEVDGGVSTKNAKELFEAGCNVLVAGNAVFSSSDPKKTIADLLSA